MFPHPVQCSTHASGHCDSPMRSYISVTPPQSGQMTRCWALSLSRPASLWSAYGAPKVGDFDMKRFTATGAARRSSGRADLGTRRVYDAPKTGDFDMGRT